MLDENGNRMIGNYEELDGCKVSKHVGKAQVDILQLSIFQLYHSHFEVIILVDKYSLTSH